ncbi:MAG: RHS repeat-associated core domain-containing protein [Thermoanaerobaculia bacterium]
MLTHRKVGAEDWIFVYTADDERIWSLRLGGGGSTVTIRDLQDRVLRSYDFNVGPLQYTDYLYREEGPVVSYAPNGTPSYYHLDHLGSPRRVSNSLGQLVASYDYYPYGEQIPGTVDTQALRFTGHERDLLNTAGLADDQDYMHARGYSPIFGRFQSADPSQANRGHMLSTGWNRYAYALGNPLRSIDPDGENAFDVVNGIVNGFGSSMLLGADRSSGNDDFRLGQQLGDIAAVAAGGLEIIQGTGTALGGVLVEAGTGGLSTVAVAAGGALAAHGASTIATASGNIGMYFASAREGNSSQSSAGKRNKEVERGQAPKSIEHVHEGRGPNEKDHVHFKGERATLNKNGSWKHGERILANKEKAWLTSHNWTLPAE